MKREPKHVIHQEYEIRDGHIEASEQTKILARILNSELLMDALSCLLLSVGSLMALLTSTALNNSLFSCLIASAISVFLIVMISRRWWILPLALAGFTVLYLIYHLIASNLSDALLFWRSFIGWILSGANYVQDFTDAGFLTALHFIIAFMVTLVLFAIIRRLFYFPALFLLQTGVFILSRALINTDLTAELCLSAAGLIVILPRVYANRIIKSKVAVEHAEVSRARMQAVAIPAALISVLISLWIIPENTMIWKSHRLNIWIDDMGTLITGPFHGLPKSSSNFNMYDLGFQAETGRLGGPVTLSEEQYLSVWSQRPVLLKGRTMDYYDGKSWKILTPDGDLRFKSPFWNNIKKETFDMDKPVGTGEATKLYEKLTTEIDITLLYKKGVFTTLFAPENVRNISFDKLFKDPEAYFNRRSELYMHSYIPYNAEYTVRSRVWNTGMNGFDELFTQLEKLTHDQKRYSIIIDRYTQLPESLTTEVYQTAASITEGIESPYLKACAISRWLAKNAEYTLEPDMPPEDTDFTAHFLNTKEGYCVYFATAMTVLARCVDLPARYVTGFALESVPEKDCYQATGQTAHAWSEVYFEGIGWLPIDPLNWNSEDSIDSLNDYMIDEKPEEHIPQNRPEQISQIPQDAQNKKTSYIWPLLLLLILALYGLFRFALWAGPRHIALVWTHDAVRRHWSSTSDQLDALYNDTLHLLMLHSLTVQMGETLVTFPERVDRFITFDGVTLTEIADMLMRSHFYGTLPDDDEIEYACLYHGQLESLTLEHLGRTRYLFKRVLKGIRFK